jgi:hypothetical protein
MDQAAQVREILSGVRYASMATVNEDGSPHNSPLVFLYDSNLEYVFWGSHPESQHSRNIVRTGKAFFAVFNTSQGSTGVYIQVGEGHMVEGEELVTALEVHNRFRTKIGKKQIDIAYYLGDSPQRMWRAKVEKVWVNAYERDANGDLMRDFRVELRKDGLKRLW